MIKHLHIKFFLLLFILCSQGGSLLAKDILMGSTSSINVNTGDYFYDDGKNRNYANDKDYTIVLKSAPGTQIQVVFESFDVESESSCGYDWLNAFDGNGTTASSLIGKYCGTTNPSPVLSTGSDLTFQFHSDGSVKKSGWKARIEVVVPSVVGQGFWFKADAGVNGNVTSWTDQSGNGHTANNSGNVSKINNRLNFNPILNFSGVNRQFPVSGTASVQTLLVVNKTPATNNDLSGLIGANGDKGVRLAIPGQSWKGDNNRDDWVNTTQVGTGRINGLSDRNMVHNSQWHIADLTRYQALSGDYYLGGYYSNRPYSGEIAEVLAVSSAVTNPVQIETYLAIKYGITLGNTTNPVDYVNASGAKVWNGSSKYQNNIAGIARVDSPYALHQKVSSTNNTASTSGSNVTMSTINDFTKSNQDASRTDLADGDYLLWGDDAGASASWQDNGDYQTVARKWKLEETGSLGTTYFQINLKSYPNAVGNYLLIVDNDQDVANGIINSYVLANTTGDLYSTSFTPPNGTSYFTIGYYSGSNITVADCLGAKTICDAVYDEPSPEIEGQGFVLNELPAVTNTCMPDEKNGIWYSFTPQNDVDADLKFRITPKQSSDDYDWVIFDVTNVNCEDLRARGMDADVFVSGNTYGSNWNNGATGADSDMGGSGNCNGPGTNNGPKWNSDVRVKPDHHYVLYVSNWSESNNGYTISFDQGGSAIIYDDIPPDLSGVVQACYGTNELKVDFTEIIPCGSLDKNDITVTIGGISYNVIDVTSANCDSGGVGSTSYVFILDRTILDVGASSLQIEASGIADMCGNVNLVTSNMSFNVYEVVAALSSNKNPVCIGEIITVTADASGGSGAYTYEFYLNDNPLVSNAQYSISDNQLSSGAFVDGDVVKVKVTDENGCFVTSAEINLTINSLPAEPTGAGAQSLCSTSTVTDLSVIPPSGSTVNWYSAANGGTALADTEVLVNGSTYYAESENTTTGCLSSSRLAVSVTVTDNEDPTAICKNITIQLDASGNASITAAQIDNGSSDNCGIASMSLSKTDFNCDNVSTNQVVASSNGYSVNIEVWPVSVNPVGTTCDYGYNYTVTLGYDISFSGSGIPAGVYTLQGTLGCGGFFSLPNGGGSGTVETTNAWRGASDCATITPEILGCTDATIVIEGPGIPNQNISLPLSSPNTVELTVVDNSGNTSTCSANVFVEDNAAPTAICKDITIQLDATGNASIVASDIDGGSSDACGILSMTASMTSFGVANVGENTVTLTVTDNNGNVSICDATVTVEDDVAPTAICKDITVQLDVSGNASITAVQIDNGSSDASGISDLSVSPSTFSCSNIGANTVTLTVTDNNSQVSTCTATVTVQDVTNPLTPTLADVTGECGATATVPTTTDACAGTITGTTSDALTYNTQGTHVIAWTFDDGNGNSIVVNQNVIIADNKAPVADLASLPNVTAQCEVTSLTAPTATDNCDGAITGTHSETFPLTASKTVVWTYTDGSGNTSTQTQNVVINDTTDPVADAASLSDVTAQCEVTSLTAPTATDNCDGAITGTHSETFPITASKTVVWTYTDGSGNTSTQTQNVVINDTTDPVADAASLSDVTAQCEVTSLTAPTATDNCDGAITGTHSETFPITASKTVVWTYTDGSGNSTTQTQNVVINDTIDPVADAASLSDVTAQCEVTSLTAPTATDNCSVVTVTSDAGLPINTQGTTVVTWTYKDVAGNTSTQTQNVIITDNIKPTITCLTDIMQVVDAGSCDAVVTYATPIGSDNCAGASTAQITGLSSGSAFPIGTTTNTFEVTDVAGNKASCSFNVTVTKENNIAVVDVSGSLSPETSDGSDNNNGNHCSDMNGLQAVISPSGYTYSPGTSQVQFRVDRLCDAGTWSFAYSIGGAGVNVDKVLITDVGTSTNSSGVISVPSEKNYVLFTIDVDNVVGTTLLIDFTISNGGTDSAIKDAITIQHNLKMIPQIVGFD
ncbi:HYR domain-containing protein [Labilibaculum euxinus]